MASILNSPIGPRRDHWRRKHWRRKLGAGNIGAGNLAAGIIRARQKPKRMTRQKDEVSRQRPINKAAFRQWPASVRDRGTGNQRDKHPSEHSNERAKHDFRAVAESNLDRAGQQLGGQTDSHGSHGRQRSGRSLGRISHSGENDGECYSEQDEDRAAVDQRTRCGHRVPRGIGAVHGISNVSIQVSDGGSIRDSRGAVIRTKCQIARAKPNANPISVNATSVPSFRSSHTPPSPGNTISRATVVIRETHSMATAIGGLLSGGLDTGREGWQFAAQTDKPQFATGPSRFGFGQRRHTTTQRTQRVGK